MASVQGQDLQEAIATALHHHDFSLLPSSFYVGLATGVLPPKTASLTSIAEVYGPGYGRIVLPNDAASFPTLVLSGSDDWKATSVALRFENTGPDDWTPADFAFITDAASGASGKFFGAATVTPFLLRAGDTFDLTWETVLVP